MKKFLKGCGITALIIFIIGIILTMIVGFAGGGYLVRDSIENRLSNWGWYSYNNVFDNFLNRHNHVDALEDSIDELQQYDKLYNIEDGFIFDNSHEIYKNKVDKEFSQVINNLSLDIGGCVFDIVESSDDIFRVEGKNMEKLQAYVENDTLYLKSLTRSNWNKKWYNRNNSKKNCTITLSIPMGHKFDKVDMSFGAGNIELGDITANNLDIEAGASYVRGNINAEEVIANVGAGQLQFEEMNITNLDVTTNVGAFYGSGRINGNALISCVLGSAELELEAAFEDYNYDIEYSASQINIGNRSYTKATEDIQVNNESMREITLDASAATIDIYFLNK